MLRYLTKLMKEMNNLIMKFCMKAHNIFKNTLFFSGKLTGNSVILTLFESRAKRGGQKYEIKKKFKYIFILII